VKPARIFIQLHSGDDIVLVDMDAILAIVGERDSTLYVGEFEQVFTVDEPPGEVLQLMHEAHVAAAGL
jgi:hypothetical protein